MRRFIISSAAALCLVFVGPGIASADDQPDTVFFDFEDMLIDGEFQRPTGLDETERGRARFDSLLNMRRSFIDEIGVAAQEDSLK